ncbi:hypothetical protein SAMN05446037_100693 [Anaerovirgula multivorans]|uniref:Uncharacterized protein n=1 Tax=Anaerovirgula multivorans TaxID=312168 RepID=A0A239CQ54_9FIRM|nr:hypothetical protein [Anaerovirgula multivorans]SNS22260.1 hypothetical protein SAMN05446037_100693 [Anaerovirgula multivorans]
MPKPTAQQLEKINKFSMVPLTEENTYVFDDLMIDTGVTSYYSTVHENLLRKFTKDANRGVGLLMSHDNCKLPIGRSFDARLVEEETEGGDLIKSVYGSFYMDLGRNTESGMTTDDVSKGIDAGTIFDTSIGFNAKTFECSICGNDIRQWWKCEHIPGRKYVVETDQGDEAVTCLVIVGEDGEGELLENSLVYAGACDRASIVRNFSTESVKEFDKGTNLYVVDNIKNVPLESIISMYYSKDGPVFFTDTPERNMKGSEELDFKQFLEQIKSVFGLQSDKPEEFVASLKKYKSDVDVQLSDLNTKVGEYEAKISEHETSVTELTDSKIDLEKSIEAKNATIAELTTENEKLTEKAGLADTYRSDLTTSTLELGVRAQGNAFNKAMYERFLGTLSIDEIKEVAQGFEKEVKSKFEGTKISTTRVKGEKGQNLTKEDFEDEQEFRDHVAAEAAKYATENKVSIGEATKIVYAQLKERNEE